jgi:ribosomal protein S11
VRGAAAPRFGATGSPEGSSAAPAGAAAQQAHKKASEEVLWIIECLLERPCPAGPAAFNALWRKT